MKMQAQLESVASATTPATVTVGVTVLLGFTLNEWVIITALIAGILQIIIFLPKVIKALIEIKKLFKGEYDGCEYGHTEQTTRDGGKSPNRKIGVRGGDSVRGCSGPEDAKG